MVYAFDLDDTLYTEMDFVYSGYRVVARELAKDSDIDADIYFEGISWRRPVGFEWALDQYRRHGGKDVEMSVDKMIEIYRGHKPEIKLRPGIGRLLENLHREGHVLVLITDGATRHQRSRHRKIFRQNTHQRGNRRRQDYRHTMVDCRKIICSPRAALRVCGRQYEQRLSAARLAGMVDRDEPRHRRRKCISSELI